MNKKDRKSIEAALDKDPSCYVLITCGRPLEESGQMDIEMSYSGDPALVSYLVESAQQILVEQDYEQVQLGVY